MKYLLRASIFNTLAISVVSYFLPGVSYDSLPSLLFAAAILALANAVLKPFLQVLIMPFNVITFGLIGWVVHVIVLWLVDYVTPGFTIGTSQITLGQTTLVFSGFWAYVVTTFLLNIVTTFITWVLGK